MMEVRIGYSWTGGVVRGPIVEPISGKARLHVEDTNDVTVCGSKMIASEHPIATILLDAAAESLSVKMPDGSVFWGSRTEVKIHGIPLCANCLKMLRRRARA
jgi:hypothetical protein